MSRCRRYEIIEQCPPCCMHETLITPTTFPLNPFCPLSPFFIDDHIDLVHSCPYLSQYPYDYDILPPYYDDFDDLIPFQNDPFHRRVKHHDHRVGLGYDHSLQRLCDRVSALEFDVDHLGHARRHRIGDRRYSWTTEIKNPERRWIDRKYNKWGAPGFDKSYKIKAEIKGRGDNCPVKKTYKFKSSPGHAGLYGDSWDRNYYGKRNFRPETNRFVDYNDPYYDHGAGGTRQAFPRRVDRIRGKRHELSPQDSAVLIQRTFRGYRLRRSQALRGHRDLAIARAKLKEIRAWFNNFSFRRRLSHDAEERQRFTERIIVLLLTVEAIEVADLMSKTAKKAIVYELETMLEAVDPESSGRLPMRRRTFDMPDGGIQKEVAAGVAQIVQMIEEEA